MTPSPGPTSTPLRANDTGFVLVGVIMFILVLTILGLSLFSLSGFEAQFFNSSLYHDDAYYAATGGIERAKWVLMRTDSLDQVRANLPAGVTYSVARQGPDFDTADSTGRLSWNDPANPVWIRALAEIRGEKCYIEARFTPTEPKQVYKQLITTHRPDSSITIIDTYDDPPLGDGSSPVRWTQTWLVGNVWQNATDNAWTKVPGVHTYSVGGVPAPDVVSFIAAKRPLAQPVSLPLKAATFNLDQGTIGGPPVYYYSAAHTSNDRAQVDLTLAGTAVWMLQDGLAIAGKVVVHESSPLDRLIIVAHGATPKTLGIDLNMIRSLVAPVILVTDSQLGIQHIFGYHDQTMVPYFAGFAEGVTLMGPRTGLTTLTLAHPNALDDVVLPPLYDAQALPNTLSGVTRSLPMISGTWRPLPTGGLN